MTHSAFTDDELLAYLDELLPAERMVEVESALRDSDALRGQVAALARRREQGVHSVGEVWRRHRLSCPTRSQLGSYLLGTLESGLADYVDFHVHTVGCRFCAANLRDLEQAMPKTAEVRQRRRKFFESSRGYLHRAE